MKKLVILLSISLFTCNNCHSQQKLSVLFWNVENLFYPADDSLTDDNEFTPGGLRYWTFNRYKIKCNLIWKTIFLSGNEGPPDIIALCEIENRKVLDELFSFSPLKDYNYQIIHQDSPDPRGIDVALVFRKDKISLIDSSLIPFSIPELKGRMTRDILHSTFLWEGDTLDLFVNHWPSKYGGTGYTDVLRMKAAELLKSKVKKLLEISDLRTVVCCGDFNDIIESRSLQLLIKPMDEMNATLRKVEYSGLFVKGTIKFQGNWEVIDHFFVNANLEDTVRDYNIKISEAEILVHDFLLSDDEKYGDKQPYRTYLGYRYIGGISDHLPVRLRLFK
jgi:predicted extracellular nuclease